MGYSNQLKYLLIAVLVIILCVVPILLYRFYYGSGIIDPIIDYSKKPIDCLNFDPDYRENIHPYHWTNSDRDVAINLIRKRNPEISIDQLHKLDNESLGMIQNTICLYTKKANTQCQLIDPTYAKNKAYQLWTAGDRDAVIELINFRHPDLSISYLNNLTDAILDLMVKSFCK